MNVYLDASVVLRRLQQKRAPVRNWAEWEHVYSSELLRVEVLRTIDRNRLRSALTDREVAELATRAHAIFDGIEFIAVSPAVLNRASQSFSTALGTLDALHLGTALRLVELRGIELVILTHDAELALAARGVNMSVEGI